MKNYRILKPLASALALLAAFAPVPAAPALAQSTTTVAVSPASQVVAAGQTFTVSIVVNPQVPIAGAQFTLAFDPGKMTVNANGVTEGNLLKQTGAPTFFSTMKLDNTNGLVEATGAITQPGGFVSTAGTFATVSFTAGATTGTSALTLSNVVVGKPDTSEVSVQLTSGSVTVGTAPQPGDANGDGSINATDITKVERIIAGLDPQTAGADANQDGLFNALDITKVERKVAGLD